jgi:hypothetical protein
VKRLTINGGHRTREHNLLHIIAITGCFQNVERAFNRRFDNGLIGDDVEWASNV